MHLNEKILVVLAYAKLAARMLVCLSVGRFNGVGFFFFLSLHKGSVPMFRAFFSLAKNINSDALESNSQTLLNNLHNLIIDNCITHVRTVARTYDMSDVLYSLCRLKGFQNPLIPTMVNINSETHYKPLITFQCSFLSGCLWKNEVMLTREWALFAVLHFSCVKPELYGLCAAFIRI